MTTEELDAIETRAAFIAEINHFDSAPFEIVRLLETDVPALIAEVKQLTEDLNAARGWIGAE